MDKRRKIVNFLKRNSSELIAATAILAMLYQTKGRRSVPMAGAFIPEKDFLRLLATDDTLVLMTPLGEFKVVPY